MDLSTTYLGMKLKNPLVPSASPLSHELDNIRRMEDAGAAAIVMHSLFEEQLTHESRQLDHYLSSYTDSFAEALSWFPEMEDYNVGPEGYLNRIREAKEAVDIPIIGSLNGVSSGGWIEYARNIQEAGADALELNIYYIPTDPRMTGADVEKMYVDVVRDVRNSISIPLAVKLSPYFSAMANVAQQLADAGADGLVLFNRFYQPDIDLDELKVVPNLVLSSAHEMRLPLRWVALLYGRVKVDYAITSGVHNYTDVLKGVMAGANVVMMASLLLQYGIDQIATLEHEVKNWLEEHEYESLAQARGSMSQQHVNEPAAFERANYMKVLQSWRPDPAGQKTFTTGNGY
jgi:dihydroorotate dehydrogenase (fumarate)